MTGTGTASPRLLKMMQLEPVVVHLGHRGGEGDDRRELVFSIYADGSFRVPAKDADAHPYGGRLPGGARSGRPALDALSPVGDAGIAAAPPPGQFGATTPAAGALDPLATALAPNPAGTVIYYRME